MLSQFLSCHILLKQHNIHWAPKVGRKFHWDSFFSSTVAFSNRLLHGHFYEHYCLKLFKSIVIYLTYVHNPHFLSTPFSFLSHTTFILIVTIYFKWLLNLLLRIKKYLLYYCKRKIVTCSRWTLKYWTRHVSLTCPYDQILITNIAWLFWIVSNWIFMFMMWWLWLGKKKIIVSIKIMG